MPELKKTRNDIFIMLGIMGLCVLFYFYLIPTQIPVSAKASQDPFTPRTFPNLLVIGIFILSVIGFITNLIKYFQLKKTNLPEREETTKEKKSRNEYIAVLMPYFFFLLIVVYYYLFTHVGFVWATILVPPVMLFVLGNRKWYLYLSVYVFAAIMYLLFRFVLYVPIP